MSGAYVGNFAAGATVNFTITTNAATGAAVAPASAFEAADLVIYKGSSATQRTSSAGVTMTSPFDSITGLHMVSIDCADNTDAGFYAAGNDYHVVLSPDETVDGVAVVKEVCHFSIENRTISQAGAVAFGAGIAITQSVTNGHGITATGNGTGAGLRVLGGATGPGLTAVGGGTSGDAILTSATSGHGIVAAGSGTTKHGIHATGGTTTSHGINAVGGGVGHGILATSGAGATGDGIRGTAASTNGNGINAVGVGTGAGVLATGGATGHGISGVGGATSGNGVRATGTAGNSAAMNLIGQGSAAGLLSTGGATGQGVSMVGGATSGLGLGISYTAPIGPCAELGIAESGTLQSATGTTAVLRSATAFADDLVIGMTLAITGGTGAGQSRLITDWVSSTDTATVETWTTTPDNTSLYEVYRTAAGSGGSGLDAAGMRAALGMASADLDTQLDALATAAAVADLPTNAELATALAAADDAVLAAIAALNNLSAATVKTQVVAALATDTYAEPGQGAPAATTTLAVKLGFLYKALRNRKTQTATEYALYADDGTTKDQEAAVSSDGTTLVVGEMATGA